MIKPLVSVHTIVKNEERFIWYALESVLNFVDKLIVFDTGSTDATVKIIRSIRSHKLLFEEKGEVDRKRLVTLRREQIRRSQSQWLLNLDGDEVYPLTAIEEMIGLMKTVSNDVVGIVQPFVSLTGDIYHKQREEKGHYQIAGREGHLTLRGIRLVKGLTVGGEYPLEAYQQAGKPIQDHVDRLVFSSRSYFHAGGLKRSAKDCGVLERKRIWDLGQPVTEKLPAVFFRKDKPAFVPDVTKRWSFGFEIMGNLKRWFRP
ncbi:hypothetical protein A3A66_00970 [Microgenomates group bacterium RIFCSPLOWO2_01_FULL_46_13]|nr:MAG: hypothetical protein A2783_00975 [Microgenomates group bacterium RIFCSPHIGHO2_01_FULL_45_11]OGV94578.1 MAG: hypothetical protein A3A66_00970 [Microgenomates group bacterium RIFCSPLOWO2_01_FULL_46_13]